MAKGKPMKPFPPKVSGAGQTVARPPVGGDKPGSRAPAQKGGGKPRPF
jgi:hypothetical protein